MWLKAIIIITTFYFTFLYVQAQTGKSCRTPNGDTATCKSIYDCRLLLNAVQTRSDEQIRFLRESQCGFDKNPLVCCGSKDNFAQSSMPQQTSTTKAGEEVQRNDAIPDRSRCGFQFSDRIFNGEGTALEEFPWMALLQYSNATGYRRYSCGGTIISSRYILTAAHCVTGDITRKIGNLVNIRLGEWNTNTDPDCVDQGDFQICNKPEDFGVEEITAHPNYNNRLIDKYNDIALVRLNRSINYSDFIRPICLPLTSESSEVGEKLTVAGWGKTERGSRSSIKLKLEVPIAERTNCANKFKSAGITLDATQLCAGGVAGKDSCTGDSGGPLMKPAKNDSSQWYIEGVVSFGAKCGTEGWPGIYTKVSRFLEWIYKTIKP